MLSFKNDPALKALHVAQAEHHAAADMLVSGTYGETGDADFRGCSVGCFAHEIDSSVGGNWHEVVSQARGLPVWLIKLQDSMFEGLPSEDRAMFHVELAKRIPVGVSLDPVPHLIAVSRIDRMMASLNTALEAKHGHGVNEAIGQVIAALAIGKRAHQAAAGGNLCELEAAWSAAWSAAWLAWSAAESAWSAAESAWLASSAARSAAWLAARSAAWLASSAAESAWSAARSAARSAAWLAAESAAWKHERDALFAALDSLTEKN